MVYRKLFSIILLLKTCTMPVLIELSKKKCQLNAFIEKSILMLWITIVIIG